MVKKLLVISTAAMIIISPMVFARGGKGNGGSRKAYYGSISQGTASQIRTQIKTQTRTKTQVHEGSGKGVSGSKGTIDKTQDKTIAGNGPGPAPNSGDGIPDGSGWPTPPSPGPVNGD